MVAGKVVKVWETDVDRYGRIVGFVFVGEKNLRQTMQRFIEIGLYEINWNNKSPCWHGQGLSSGGVT